MLTTGAVIPGVSCQANGCEQKGSAGGPVQHETYPVAGDIDGLKVQVFLCPEHRKELKRLRDAKRNRA